MKIYTSKTIVCPICDGDGEVITNISHNGNPEYDVDIQCRQCRGSGEVTNKFSKQEELVNLSRNLLKKSLEISRIASNYYNDMAKLCSDINHENISSGYIEDGYLDQLDSIDPECQELHKLFDEFSENKLSFLVLLEQCTSEEEITSYEDTSYEEYTSYEDF
jgi:RecJ-like exonuclease